MAKLKKAAAAVLALLGARALLAGGGLALSGGTDGLLSAALSRGVPKDDMSVLVVRVLEKSE